MKKLVAIPQMTIGIMVYLLHFVLARISPVYNALPIRWYLGDFLALIVCVPLFVNIMVLLKLKHNKNIKFEILFYFFVFSMLYEGILPLRNKKLTADFYDVIAYAFGGLVLYFSHRYTYNIKGKI
jgi:integral membrane sensor domain MASE1